MVFGLVVFVYLIYKCDTTQEDTPVVAHKGQSEEGEKKKKKKNKTKKVKEETTVKEVVQESDDTEPEVVIAPKKKEKKQQEQPKAAAKQNKKPAEAVKPKEQVKEQPKEVPPPIVKEVPVPVKKVHTPMSDDDSFDSGDSWEPVKEKKKQHTTKPLSAGKIVDHGSAFGGKTSKGFMVAGPI